MLNLYKDQGSGTFRYDFTINKKRHRGAIKEARTHQQAKQVAQSIWDRAFNRKFNTGRHELAETPFSDFYRKRFLPHSRLHKRSHADDVWVGDVLCKFFGCLPIEEITWEHIEQFKLERSGKRTRSGGKRSHSTINRELSILSKALTIAVKARVIPRNPCGEVERFKVDNARIRFLSEPEESRLYEALSDHQIVKNVVTVALNTGMRQGEIFNLSWRDVDLTRGVIHVRRTKTCKVRFVPMNSRLRELLQGLNRSSEYVFPSPKTGRALIDVKRQFDKAKRLAGLEDFRFHDLRHTVASRMADHGADIFTIAAILGHRDIRTTVRYTYATDRARRVAVESLTEKASL